MEKARLKDISLDEEDAALFNLKGDLLLKAKAIKYSILPKLNILLEETLSRIRKIYGIEVFNNDSIIHSAPNFREKRQNYLKVDYAYAFWGLGASRLPIWEGFKRIDNKPAKIIPYIIGYQFDDYGLSVVFDPLRYPSKYTREANEIFLNFLLENIEYVQTIQSLSEMSQILYGFKNKNIIRPFKEIIEDYKSEYIYDIRFIRTIKYPLNYNELNSMITSFVIFFPIYYALLEIAKNKQCSFKSIVSKLSYDHLFNDYPYEQNIASSNVTETVNIKIDETKFIKSGIRWQVFERDDFKCVACGKSSHDGAILHVDHIIP
ncbi:MAG: HNH endonuclease, partial [Spirochaetaceae bacterium]|nr:HNH endonuclease [Spirochaetaceae bacterium]